ncbi:MAG: DUF3185 family protein [Thiohalophilus sp.]|nr:DUF3185 family protein [Thiohalophilus sp.]MDZ7804562.1 DUF3185 family protein [Thiohalophilus sp.]
MKGKTQDLPRNVVILKTPLQLLEINMEMHSGTTMKIIGIVLVVLGIGLAIWGYQLSGSVGSQITQAVTGSDTDKVMTFYIVGAISFVVGIYLFAKK